MPAKLEAMLAREGLAGAAKSLNQTVPHRYTAIFLRDGASLRNVALFDKAERLQDLPGLIAIEISGAAPEIWCVATMRDQRRLHILEHRELLEDIGVLE